MLELGKNIESLQIFVGTFLELKESYSLNQIHYKEHPLNHAYMGVEEPRDWISTAVTGYFPSFFAYWKLLNKELLAKQISK